MMQVSRSSSLQPQVLSPFSLFNPAMNEAEEQEEMRIQQLQSRSDVGNPPSSPLAANLIPEPNPVPSISAVSQENDLASIESDSNLLEKSNQQNEASLEEMRNPTDEEAEENEEIQEKVIPPIRPSYGEKRPRTTLLQQLHPLPKQKKKSRVAFLSENEEEQEHFEIEALAEMNQHADPIIKVIWKPSTSRRASSRNAFSFSWIRQSDLMAGQSCEALLTIHRLLRREPSVSLDLIRSRQDMIDVLLRILPQSQVQDHIQTLSRSRFRHLL